MEAKVKNHWKKITVYLQKDYPAIIINVIITFLAVLLGAFLALFFTKSINQSDERENYLSIINSCKKMNEHYLQNVEEIIAKIDSGYTDYSQAYSFIENVNNPFLFKELITNSNLYKYSSEDFKNWLPTIISFFQEGNWSISKANLNSYCYAKEYLISLESVLINEIKFINKKLNEEEVHSENLKARKPLGNYLGEVGGLRIPQEVEMNKDSTNFYKAELDKLNK